MLISVIVPTCDRIDLLTKCLDRLSPLSQTLDKSLYEVIVTDDSKDFDINRQILEKQYQWVKWVRGPRKGPASNRNNGAANADGDWYVFIDDDCLPDMIILSEYYNYILKNDQIQAIEGRIYVNYPKMSLLDESPINTTGGRFWSCNICIKANLFKQLGGFDILFPFAAMEDVDFFLRLKEITNNYIFLYEASVIHPWRTNKNLARTTLKRCQSHIYYFYKHPQEKKRINSLYFFRLAYHSFKTTIVETIKTNPIGFKQKIMSDFLYLLFGFSLLFKTERIFLKFI